MHDRPPILGPLPGIPGETDCIRGAIWPADGESEKRRAVNLLDWLSSEQMMKSKPRVWSKPFCIISLRPSPGRHLVRWRPCVSPPVRVSAEEANALVVKHACGNRNIALEPVKPPSQPQPAKRGMCSRRKPCTGCLTEYARYAQRLA